MNYVCISGRLTKDPVVSMNREGTKKFARFVLAVRRNGKEDSADFVPCVAFEKTADLVEKTVHKGTPLLIEGRIQTDSFTDRDGKKQYSWNVAVLHLEYMEPKPKEEPVKMRADDGFMDPDDNLPFN